MEIESKIQNCHLLTDIFGRLPSFHDAEVLSINLSRGKSAYSPESILEATIHVFEMTSEINERGEYVLRNHVLVKFLFSKIVNLNLTDFNHQNVLNSLQIVHLSDKEEHKVKFRVIFEGIFGVKAKFHCSSVSVESVEPYVKEQH